MRIARCIVKGRHLQIFLPLLVDLDCLKQVVEVRTSSISNRTVGYKVSTVGAVAFQYSDDTIILQYAIK